MARRGVLVLAVIAALLGAPQVASAAANVLGSPSASPTAGTTSTVFVLRVDYRGQFAANGVTALVGSRALAMSLVAGSASSGTWSAATTMPPGRWPVLYTADVSQGNAPSLSGPTLTVHAAASTRPAPVPTSASNLRTEAGAGAPTSGGAGSTHAPAPAHAPAASAPAQSPNAAPPPPAATDDRHPSTAGDVTPGQPNAAPAPSGEPAPARDDGVQPEPTPAAEIASTPGGAADGDGAAGTAETPRDGVMSGTQAPRPVDAAAAPLSADGDLLRRVLLLALSGVAATGLVGSALLVVGRRRRPAATPDATVASEPAMISRRARRIARAARLDDDPILASLGIGRPRSSDAAEPDRTKPKDGR